MAYLTIVLINPREDNITPVPGQKLFKFDNATMIGIGLSHHIMCYYLHLPYSIET